MGLIKNILKPKHKHTWGYVNYSYIMKNGVVHSKLKYVCYDCDKVKYIIKK